MLRHIEQRVPKFDIDSFFKIPWVIHVFDHGYRNDNFRGWSNWFMGVGF